MQECDRIAVAPISLVNGWPMRRSIHSDEDIRLFVQDLLAGRPAEEICAIAGVSERTLYRWRRRFAGLKPFAVRALRDLEQENRRLRHQLAGSSRQPNEVGVKSKPVLRSDLGRGSAVESLSRPAAVVGRYAALRIR